MPILFSSRLTYNLIADVPNSTFLSVLPDSLMLAGLNELGKICDVLNTVKDL